MESAKCAVKFKEIKFEYEGNEENLAIFTNILYCPFFETKFVHRLLICKKVAMEGILSFKYN